MSTTVPASSNEADNIAYKLIAATVVAIVLPTIALGLRLLARKVQRLHLYFDDWLMVIAFAFKVGLDISGSLLIEHGMGRHITTVSAHDLVIFLQIQYTGVIQYPLCVTFTKLSILYQYRRLFPTRDFRIMTNALVVVMIMWCTSVVFTGIFLCTPISKSWYPSQPGTCINLVSFYYGMQIPNVVTDMLVLLLPLREVQKLDLPLKQKLGVGLTCGLWVVALAFGAVRLAVMIELSNQGPDVTYNLVNAAIWTTIEPAVAISTACLPSIRILYRTAKSQHARRLSHRLDSMDFTTTNTTHTGTVDSTHKDVARATRMDSASTAAHGFELHSPVEHGDSWVQGQFGRQHV